MSKHLIDAKAEETLPQHTDKQKSCWLFLWINCCFQAEARWFGHERQASSANHQEPGCSTGLRLSDDVGSLKLDTTVKTNTLSIRFCQVMLKAVNQSNWNVLHKDLSMYEPVRMLQLGEDLKLEPPLSQDRPLLKAAVALIL